MDAAAEDGGEDHLNVFGEGIVVEVVEIEADLVSCSMRSMTSSNAFLTLHFLQNLPS